MPQSSGTITISVGSNIIVGAGTLFTKEAATGKFITIFGLRQVFQIAQVVDDTNLLIGAAPKGQAGMSVFGLVYAICDHFTPTIGLPMPTANLVNAQVRAVNRAMVVLDREIPSAY